MTLAQHDTVRVRHIVPVYLDLLDLEEDELFSVFRFVLFLYLAANILSVIKIDVRIAVTRKVVRADTREICSVERLREAKAFLPPYDVIPTARLQNEFDRPLATNLQNLGEIGGIEPCDVLIAVFLGNKLRIHSQTGKMKMWHSNPVTKFVDGLVHILLGKDIQLGLGLRIDEIGLRETVHRHVVE